MQTFADNAFIILLIRGILNWIIFLALSSLLIITKAFSLDEELPRRCVLRVSVILGTSNGNEINRCQNMLFNEPQWLTKRTVS